MNQINVSLINHWLIIAIVILLGLIIGGVVLLAGLERAEYKAAAEIELMRKYPEPTPAELDALADIITDDILHEAAHPLDANEYPWRDDLRARKEWQRGQNPLQ